MFTDSAKNPVWPRCYFGTRDTWLDWLSLFSTKVITITLSPREFPHLMTMFRYLVNWQMTEMQTRLCINLNQTYYRNWYCVWEAIYQLVYNWGVHGICQSNNFPVLHFLIPTQNSVGKNIDDLFYLWNISLSDLPFGSRPNIWQVFDKF